MKKAIRIKMKENSKQSNNPKDIDGFYIDDGQSVLYFSVEDLFGFLKNEPSEIIQIADDTSSSLVPVNATNGKGYIRSIPNRGMIDSLMRLPRE